MKSANHEVLRIMLVDEQPERFDLLNATLSEQGYQVVANVGAHENIHAAVEKCRPDVIIRIFSF